MITKDLFDSVTYWFYVVFVFYVRFLNDRLLFLMIILDVRQPLLGKGWRELKG